MSITTQLEELQLQMTSQDEILHQLLTRRDTRLENATYCRHYFVLGTANVSFTLCNITNVPLCEGGLQDPIDGGISITTNQLLLDKLCGVSNMSLLNLSTSAAQNPGNTKVRRITAALHD